MKALQALFIAMGILSIATTANAASLPQIVGVVPASRPMTENAQKYIIPLFVFAEALKLPCERNAVKSEEGSVDVYQMVELKCRDFSARLYMNAHLSQVTVDVIFDGDTYSVSDDNGDGIIEEVSDSHDLLEVDDDFRAKLSAQYQEKVAVIIKFAEANMK